MYVLFKNITDTCLICGTVVHLYNTYTPQLTWSRHKHGHNLVAIFIKAFVANMVLPVLHLLPYDMIWDSNTIHICMSMGKVSCTIILDH